MHYRKEPVGKTRCLLCPHRCLLSNGKIGRCLARQNKDGVLYTLIYGEVSSYSMDPMEKKPLYHFYPGKMIFSIGSWGCNFKCTFCQNWNISQQKAAVESFEKDDIIGIALQNNSIGIAYTYNEPFVWYEFVLDTAKAAKEKGLKNVLVTNGFVSDEPLKEILPYIDAMNIDIKAGNESFYREICDGQLAQVMKTIKAVHEAGVHLELTHLVIPTLTDKPDEIREISSWIAEMSPDIPFHLTRYFPQYKMNIASTPLLSMKEAYEIAKEKLNYVYLGNMSDEHGGNITACPQCSAELIVREPGSASIRGLKAGKCGKCGKEIPGIF